MAARKTPSSDHSSHQSLRKGEVDVIRALLLPQVKTVTQAALHLGIPVETARGRLKEARDRLGWQNEMNPYKLCAYAITHGYVRYPVEENE